MNNGIKYVFTFALGAAVGVVASWQFLKAKYEQIADEEIESMRALIRKLNPEKEEDKEPEVSEKDIKEYAAELAKTGYVRYSDSEKVEGVKTITAGKPYVIPPEDFGENDYDRVDLTYYADEILANEDDEIMDEDDIEQLVGKDSLTHFGEFEDDSVYVRNDAMKTDYAILIDTRKYSDVFPDKAEE